MIKEALRVLLVEDEWSLREPLAKRLRDAHGYHVDPAANTEEAWQLVKEAERPYDVALIDDLLTPQLGAEPEPVGIELMGRIKECYPETECIIFTGWGMERALEALRAGAYRYLAKPLNLDELAMTIRMAAEQARLRRERDLLSATLEISRAMLSELDVGKTLKLITEAVSKLVGAEACAVARVDSATGRVWYEPVVPLGDAAVRWHRHLRKVELTKQIIETGGPFGLSDVDTRADEVDENLHRAGVKSFIGVPILGEPQNLGVLYAYSTRREAFGAHEQRVLYLLAGQAAIALENAQLYEETRRRAEEMKLLYDLSVVLNSSLDLEEVLDRIAKSASSLIQAETSTALIWDERRGCYIQRGIALTPGRHVIVDEPRSDGFTTLVMNRNKPVIVPDVTRHKRAKAFLLEMGVRSMAGVPIQHSGKAIGVLFVHSTVPHRFSEHEVALLSFLANQAALAIENARLFEAEARRRQEAETLRETALALTTTLEQQEIFERILSELQKVVPYDSASVQLLKGDQLEIIGGRGFPNLSGILGVSFPMDGNNPNREVMRKRAPLIVSDAQAEYPGFSQEPHIQADIHGWLGVPMLIGDRLIGMIALDKHEPGFYAGEHTRLAQTFAAQAAVAIENALLFEQTQRDLHIVSHLYEISSQPYSVHDPDQTLQLIAESVKEVTGALSASITALDTAGRPYEKAHTGYTEKERVVRRHGLSTEVMRTGEPYIISDITQVADIVNPGMIKSGVKAAICLPLRIQSRNAGVMWITYAQPHHFADAEIKFLGLIASHASTVIETSRLFQEREFLLETSQMVLSAQDLDQSLQILAEKLVHSLVVTFCRISLLDDTGRSLTTRAAYPILDDLAWNPGVGQSYLLDEAPDEAKAIETGQRQILRLEQSPDLLSSLKHRTRSQDVLKAAVLIPLTVGKEVFGVITLGERWRWERGSFALERVALCEAVADQVAALITRMRLQEQAERDLDNIRRLYEASSRIGSMPDPDQTMRFIVEKACQAVEGWRAASVLLGESGRPHRLSAVGFDKKLAAATSIRADGISTQVVKTGEPYLIEDVKAQADKVNPAMIQDGVQAAICLPLRLGESSIGVLWIHYKKPQQFLPAQIEALKLYATQAAIAYDNARRMRQLEHMRKAAEAMAGALDLREVLQRIVESARQVLQADSSAIWSYDNVRNQFIPAELVADGISRDELEKFRKNEPKRRGTASTIMDRGWVGVKDISDPQYEFMGPSTRELLENIGAKSFQGIALKVGTENLGVLYANYNRLRSFTKEDKERLETFANQAALALKKARLLEQVSKARDAAKVVAEVTVLEDLEETLDSIVRGIQDALDCDAVTLYTYDQDKEKLGYPPNMIGVEYPKRVVRLSEVPRGSIILEMLQRDEPYVVEDIASDQFFKGRRFAVDEGIKSCVGIPLKVGDHKVGVAFINYRSLHRFTTDELTNIELFANQAAVAIRNAQLYEQVQKRATALQALYEAGGAVASTLALDEILKRIVEQAWRLAEPRGKSTHFSHLAFVDGSKVSFVAAYPQVFLSRLKQRVGDIDLEQADRIGVTGRVVKTRQSQRLGDISEDPDFIECDLKTKSELAVPIKIGEQVIGVINIEHPDYNAFDEEDQRVLESLAGQAAIAIQNARSYEELKQTKGLVGARTALAWMGMASSSWRHAIRNYATTIQDLVELARRDIAARATAEKVRERLSRIEDIVARIQGAPITAPLQAEEGVRSVAINELLEERVKQLWGREPYKSVQIALDPRVDESTTVRASPDWLRRAFDILIDNAVEAMADSAPRQLTIVTQLTNGGVELTFTDTGKGIPDEVLQRLFQAPIPRPKGAKGSGVGLLMAHAIVETYGGDIRVGSTCPSGTAMIIWLPVES
jgi:GAF domain-containing protein/ActR/RegA family two-component response regulator